MTSFKIIGLLVLEKKIFKGFCYLLPWQPFWSCDLDFFFFFFFFLQFFNPLPNNAPHKFGFNWPSVFREKCLNIMVIYVCSPRTGAHNPKGSFFFFINNFSVHLHTTSKFRPPPLFLRMLHMMFGFDLPSGFRGEDF